MPHDAEGPGTGQQQVDDEPDHDRRQPHQAVQNDDQRASASKLVHGNRSAEGQADRAADQSGGEADTQTEQDDADELRVGGDDQPECLSGGFGNAVHGFCRVLSERGLICKYVQVSHHGWRCARS